MPRYLEGQVVKVTGTVTDTESGKEVDPAKTVGTVIKPDGSIEQVSPSKVKEGKYEWRVPATQAGKWELIGDGIGAHDTAGRIIWHVDKRDARRPT